MSVAVCIILDGGGGGGSGRRDGYTSNLRYPGRGQRVSEGGNGYCLVLFGPSKSPPPATPLTGHDSLWKGKQ